MTGKAGCACFRIFACKESNPMQEVKQKPKVHLSYPEKVEVARKVCVLYATGKYTLTAICRKFGITASQFTLWAQPHMPIAAMLVRGDKLPSGCIPEVHEMAKKAREQAGMSYKQDLMERAKSGLLKKVEGWTGVEVTEDYEIDKDPESETFGERVYKKKRIKKIQHAPDTQAIIFTLTNTDPDNFKVKSAVDVAATVSPVTDIETLSYEELVAKEEQLNRRLEQISSEHKYRKGVPSPEDELPDVPELEDLMEDDDSVLP